MTYELGERLILDAASWSFGIHGDLTDPDIASLAQEVGPWIHDARGRTTLASVGVLADLSLAIGTHKIGGSGVLASITVSMANELPAEGVLIGCSDHCDVDEESRTALLGAFLHDAEGRVMMRIRGRLALVDRPRLPGESAILDGIDLRAVFDPSQCGALGAYASWLRLQVNHSDSLTTSGTWTALAWEANAVGGVQGGVMLGLMSTITELAADPLAEPGQNPRLAELHVDFFRAPTPTLGQLTFRTTTVRKSRRFANIDVTVQDSAQRVVAQSRGTLLFPIPA